MVHALYTDSRCSLLFPFNKKNIHIFPFLLMLRNSPPNLSIPAIRIPKTKRPHTTPR